MVKNHYLYLPPDIPHATEIRSTNTDGHLFSKGPQEVTDWADGKMVQQYVPGEDLSIHRVMVDTSGDMMLTFQRLSNNIYLLFTLQGEPGYIHRRQPEYVFYKQNRPVLFYAPRGENKILIKKGKTIWICLRIKAESLPEHPAINIVLMYYYLRSFHHCFAFCRSTLPVPADIIAAIKEFRQNDPVQEANILRSIIKWMGIDKPAGHLRSEKVNTVHILKDFIEVQVRKGTLPHINEMSESLNMHPDTLSRTFKMAFGTSLKKFITAQKMEEAHRLLTEECRSTRYVSEKLGYNSPSSFRFQFKLFYGYTPSYIKAFSRQG